MLALRGIKERKEMGKETRGQKAMKDLLTEVKVFVLELSHVLNLLSAFPPFYPKLCVHSVALLTKALS